MVSSRCVLAKGIGGVAVVGVGLVLGCPALSAAPALPALAVPPAPVVFQIDEDGEARVTVDIAPADRDTAVSIEASATDAVDDASAGGTARRSAQTVEDDGIAAEAAARVASPAGDAIDAATAPLADATPNEVVIGDIETGGQDGATVIVGDTRGGRGEPGALGGDAIVEVSIGPIADGVAIEGNVTAGGVEPFDPDAASLDQDPSDDIFIDATISGDDSDAEAVGVLNALGLAPEGEAGLASPGSAVGGDAERGDASVLVVIGDTIGGDARGGQPGGDAIVKLEVGPVVGGDATGGDAVGGDAVQGSGTAVGGSAVGGDARGGDAVVVIGVGDTRGTDGALEGPGADAAVLVDLGSVVGGEAVGGDATGGEGSGLLGIEGTGGDAVGGDAEGGTAFAVIRVEEMVGGQYRADVDRIVGGDATGGEAIGGDALDLTVDADLLIDLRVDDGQ